MSEILRLSEFGGVNLADHPRDLADNEFAWAENIYPLSASTLALRGGSVRVLGVGNGIPASDKPTALIGYNHSDGRRFIYCITEAFGLPYRMNLWLLNENENLWVQIVTDAPSAAEYNPAWAIWRDRLYLLRGDGLLAEIEGNTVVSTTALTTTVSTVGVAFFPKLIATYRNRMLYAGDPTYPNFVFFSNPDTPLTIAPDQVIRVGRGDGGRLRAIAITGTTGGDAPAEAQVLLLKEQGRPWLFRGDLPTAGANAGQADLHPLSKEADCVNHRTLAMTPQGLMWAGYDDVFIMRSIGALPESVGHKIQPQLKYVSPGRRYQMRAVYYDGFYRLMLDRGTDDRSRTTMFWADVRTPSIKWWGPMVGGHWADLYADHRPSAPSRLLAITANDSYAGYMYTLDMKNGEEAIEAAYPTSDRTILPVLRTKEYDFGDANTRKVIEAAELNFWNDRTREVTVTFLGDTNRARAVTYNAGGWTLGNTLPSGALSSLHSQMNFSAQVSGRTVSRTLQLQIEASSLGSETDVGPFMIQELVLRLRRIQRRVA